MIKPRVLLSWSTGKDAAWTLYALRATNDFDVVGLLTTVNGAFDRVAMHATRSSVLRAQAKAVGLPVLPVLIPWPCPNGQYESAMALALSAARADLGVTHIAFGDLFLEDVRRYRETQLAGTGLAPLFPLWQMNTRVLAEEMISSGLRAVVSCVDLNRLPAAVAGQSFDSALLSELPADVDPCGEGGEFHTIAWDGPMFEHPVECKVGEVVERDGFAFADVLLAQQRS
jgi:uncharacterized protein (TIGR00290 family)